MGVEATAKKQLEAAALLGAASTKRTAVDEASASVPDEGKAREIANVVSQAGGPRAAKRLSEALVPWVDDNPSNNIYERKSMEALGIRFAISTSTQDALEKVRSSKYDVIISDMGRGDDPRAGYKLLEELQKFGVSTPFIIYAGSNRPEHKVEAQKKGAFGSTNNPQELFQLVLSALESRLQ